MVKPRSKQSGNKKNQQQEVENLIERLADKPYGTEAAPSIKQEDEKLERITITLPQNLRDTLDDLALQRKRQNLSNKTVSSIVREALELYLNR